MKKIALDIICKTHVLLPLMSPAEHRQIAKWEVQDVSQQRPRLRAHDRELRGGPKIKKEIKANAAACASVVYVTSDAQVNMPLDDT